MISWIQTSFKTHFRIIFLLLLAVVIISFVFTIGAMPGLSPADQERRAMKVFGVSYTTPDEQRAFVEDGQMSLFLTSGQMFFSPEQTERHAFSRAAAIAKANEIGIPEPTDKQVVDFIKTLPVFFGENGEFDPQQYQRFLDTTRDNPQFTQGRISRVIAANWRAQQATRAIAGPGFALDPEIRDQIAAADTAWTVHTATLATTDIQPTNEPTEAELQQWFENNAARYRLPPTVQVSVIEFPAERFRANVMAPNDDDIVRFFESRKSSYAAPATATAEGETPVVQPEPKLEDVRDRVVADLLAQRASTAASKAAADFAYTLFDKQIVRGTQAFDIFLAQQGTTLRPIPPLPLSREAAANPVAREAATLSESKPVSDPIVVGSTTLLLFFDGRSDAADAMFSAVRDRVLADVKEDARVRAVVARGNEIRAQLDAAVKSGTPFPDAAKAAGLETKVWENFTRRALPEDFDRSILSRMIDQPKGEVSPMTLLGDTGSYIFVAQRTEPTVSAEDPAYAETRRTVMSETSRITTQIALLKMVQDEMIASGLMREDEAAAQ